MIDPCLGHLIGYFRDEIQAHEADTLPGTGTGRQLRRVSLCPPPPSTLEILVCSSNGDSADNPTLFSSVDMQKASLVWGKRGKSSSSHTQAVFQTMGVSDQVELY
ncbi:hypothetical protein H0G86_010736 [Trichoderma simmonsii]|uniref:Uncharacterized protein n=1 Tax=Trichoderma simmonsii TaxID=1491479 RepID=A0A8G0PKC0_9HYPO|nr:hypothetical protein H0G86_010736 [Trichoderma simmonsii]